MRDETTGPPYFLTAISLRREEVAAVASKDEFRALQHARLDEVMEGLWKAAKETWPEFRLEEREG